MNGAHLAFPAGAPCWPGDALLRPGYPSNVRLASLPLRLAPLLLATGLGGCATSPSSAAAVPTPSASAPAPAPTPEADTSRPPRPECDAFMDVVARTTTLRAAIQTEPSTAAKADEWAARTTALAAEAKALPVSQEDLVIEAANLATRMGELAKQLRALATAERARAGEATALVHKRVLSASEQVEVILREPAARCSGDPKKLIETPGRLAAAEIQIVVRASFGKLRSCYEAGLKRDPNLQGRVVVRFVIGRDGKVAAAGAATSEPIPSDAVSTPSSSALPLMPDKDVVACVVRGFEMLTFPKPEGGIITVVYPINFSPSE